MVEIDCLPVKLTPRIKLYQKWLDNNIHSWLSQRTCTNTFRYLNPLMVYCSSSRLLRIHQTTLGGLPNCRILGYPYKQYQLRFLSFKFERREIMFLAFCKSFKVIYNFLQLWTKQTAVFTFLFPHVHNKRLSTSFVDLGIHERWFKNISRFCSSRSGTCSSDKNDTPAK